MRPARGSNVAREYQKNEDLKGKIELFSLFSKINWILTHNSKFLYSCGPWDLTLSLMRPASPFKFETPDLKKSTSHRLRNAKPCVNFINILRARFLYKSAFFCQNITREKHFSMKNARVKWWWNWPHEIMFLASLFFNSSNFFRFCEIVYTFT
jgi:hypothetical protein